MSVFAVSDTVAQKAREKLCEEFAIAQWIERLLPDANLPNPEVVSLSSQRSVRTGSLLLRLLYFLLTRKSVVSALEFIRHLICTAYHRPRIYIVQSRTSSSLIGALFLHSVCTNNLPQIQLRWAV